LQRRRSSVDAVHERFCALTILRRTSVQPVSNNSLFLVVAMTAFVLLGGCDYFVTPEARLERARAQIGEGNYRAALVDLKNALQKEPDLHAARLLLAEAALWLGDATSANVELQRVPATEDVVKVADLQTRIALALGRSQEVLDRLAVADGPIKGSKLHLYRGLALQGLKQPAEAEKAFRQAAALDPDLIMAQAGIAESLAAQGELDRAAEVAARSVQQAPTSAQAWATQGFLLASRDAGKALQAMERAQELAPSQLEVVKQIAVLSTLTELQLADGALDRARASSEKLGRLAPGSPIALLMSSRIAMATNDYVTAAAELRRVVNAAPRFVQARFMLGVALAAQGNLEQASQELAAAVEQAPELIEARQLLARVRMRLDDPDGALRVLVPALESAGDDMRFTTLVNAARMQTGSSAGTVALLEKELARNPGNAGVANQLASAYLQAGQAVKALELLRRTQGDALDAQREATHLQAILAAEGESAARSRAESLFAAHSTDTQIVSLVAAFLTHLGDAESGRRHLVSALSRAPDDPNLLLALAQLEWTARRPAEARIALQKLLKIQAGHTGARLALAELELATGNRSAAQEQLEVLRKQDQRAAAPRLLLARLALGIDDAKQAEALIAEALKGGAGEGQIHAAAGTMYLEHGRYDQAIEHLRAGVQVDPGAAELWLGLGRAQLALNQHAAARESFEKALAVRPRWIAAEGALTFLDLQLGNRAAALQRVAALKEARPRDASVFALEGHLHSSLRQYREAATAFDAAAAIELTGPIAISGYQARLAAGLPDSEAPLEQWVRLHPDDLNYRSVLADAYTRAGERQKAIEQYELIVRRVPSHAASLNNLAWLYYEQKDPRATDTARRASAAAPDSGEISDTLGWILVESGRTEEGLPILRDAAARARTTPEIVYHYAAALLRAGETAEGRRQLDLLLKDHASFPSRAAAEQLLSQLERGVAASGR
jgi:cellulose synthase operon protein C